MNTPPVYKKVLILFSILFLPSILYLVLTTGKHNFVHLPYFHPSGVETKEVNGKEVSDTVYKQIQSFQFINQDSIPFSDKDLEDKIYVADFFFTTCKSICKDMTSQLLRVQEKFIDAPEFMIVSHTVDPEHDKPHVLKEHAKFAGLKQGKWVFLTGEKKELYDMARHSYFINAMEGDGGEEDFIHSEMFVLVDKEKHIRGYYDGTSHEDVDRMIDDIKVLMAEYKLERKDIKHKKKNS